MEQPDAASNTAPTEPAPPAKPQQIPYETLEKIAQAYLDEQRANRRWRNVYRIGILLLALIGAGSVGAALDAASRRLRGTLH